jgi:arginine repressor
VIKEMHAKKIYKDEFDRRLYNVFQGAESRNEGEKAAAREAVVTAMTHARRVMLGEQHPGAAEGWDGHVDFTE